MKFYEIKYMVKNDIKYKYNLVAAESKSLKEIEKKYSRSFTDAVIEVTATEISGDQFENGYIHVKADRVSRLDENGRYIKKAQISVIVKKATLGNINKFKKFFKD